jgi:TPP-dependent pyruvate/acetoin dehydrogenase alpha subunit
LAEKKKKSDAIVVIFVGDGTFGEGVVYESLNMASLWNVPLLIVQEDNKIAQSTPSIFEQAGDALRKVSSFGILCAELEANDVSIVFETASKAVDHVRTQQKPYFIRLHTYRLAPHSKGDDTRSAQELKELWSKDPLAHLREKLTNADIDVAAIEKKVEELVRIGFEKVMSDLPIDWGCFKETMIHKGSLT